MKNSSQQTLAEFAYKYFSQLGCNIELRKNGLFITNIPPTFLNYVQKEDPLFVTFSEEDEGELLSEGSYFLQKMTDYLSNSAQQTLQKIELPVDIDAELQHRLRFAYIKKEMHSRIYYDHFFRFTFSSQFQYLNEQEQQLNNIFVHDGDTFEIPLDRFTLIEGNPQELNLANIDVEGNINSAKQILSDALAERRNSLSEKLREHLTKEINRVEEHYAELAEETKQQLHTLNEEIHQYKKELSTAKGDTAKTLQFKLQRNKNAIKKLEENNNPEKIKKETEFFKNDEIRKHGLSIDSKLINTTIIYYPIHKVDIRLISTTGNTKTITVEYNPLTRRFYPPQCEKCSENLTEVNLCMFGHVICSHCSMSCLDCQKTLCLKCDIHQCQTCQKNTCKHCITQCRKCRKKVCGNHGSSDFLSGVSYCNSCISKCNSCGQATQKHYFKKCPKCDREQCPKCLKSQVGNMGIDISCIQCTKKTI